MLCAVNASTRTFVTDLDGRGKESGHGVEPSPARSILVGVAAFLTLATGATAGPVTKLTNFRFAYPSLSPDGQRLVYQSNVTGQWELFVMGVDGTGVVRLTDDDSEEMMPDWSPDGGRIAFVSNRTGDLDVYTIRPDGSELTALTHDDFHDQHPYWSADGERIVVSTSVGRERLQYDIRVLRADGSGVETVLGDGLVNSYASSSPDGSEILFDRWVDNDPENGEIFILELADGSLRRLTDNEGIYDGYPAWSADGRHVIWSSNETGSFQLYAMDRRGRGRVQLTSGRGDHRRVTVARDGSKLVYNRELDGSVLIEQLPLAEVASGVVPAGPPERVSRFEAAYPAWSPDGEHIVFQSDALGQWELFVMKADGSDVRQLTRNPRDDMQPAWSPDGELVAFASDRDGDMEIFTIRPNGTGLRRLTRNERRDIHPHWSPDGSALIFNREDERGRLSLLTLALDGSGERVVLSGDQPLSYASFSPDGAKIAFVKWLDDGKNGEIYLLDPALGVETRLTENGIFDGYPVWSPAGDAILFSRQAGPSAVEFDLLVIDLEDRSVRRLTEGEGSDVRADWSAASGIVFNREQESGTEIVVLDPSRPSG